MLVKNALKKNHFFLLYGWRAIILYITEDSRLGYDLEGAKLLRLHILFDYPKDPMLLRLGYVEGQSPSIVRLHFLFDYYKDSMLLRLGYV